MRTLTNGSWKRKNVNRKLETCGINVENSDRKRLAIVFLTNVAAAFLFVFQSWAIKIECDNYIKPLPGGVLLDSNKKNKTGIWWKYSGVLELWRKDKALFCLFLWESDCVPLQPQFFSFIINFLASHGAWRSWSQRTGCREVLNIKDYLVIHGNISK